MVFICRYLEYVRLYSITVFIYCFLGICKTTFHNGIYLLFCGIYKTIFNNGSYVLLFEI